MTTAAAPRQLTLPTADEARVVRYLERARHVPVVEAVTLVTGDGFTWIRTVAADGVAIDVRRRSRAVPA